MTSRLLSFTLLFLALTASFTFQSCKDECKEVACLNGGTCDDGDCTCENGFTGDRCQTGPCDNVECLNNGTCVNGVCDCPDGYEGSDCGAAERDKFIGTYLTDGTYTCDGVSTPQSGYPVFISTT